MTLSILLSHMKCAYVCLALPFNFIQNSSINSVIIYDRMRLASSFAEIWLRHWQHKPSQGGHIRVPFRRLSEKTWMSKLIKLAVFCAFLWCKNAHGIMDVSWRHGGLYGNRTQTCNLPAALGRGRLQNAWCRREMSTYHVVLVRLPIFHYFSLLLWPDKSLMHLCIYIIFFMLRLHKDTSIMTHKLWWLCQLPFDCMERMDEPKKLQASWGKELSRTYQAERWFGQTCPHPKKPKGFPCFSW